MKKIIFTFLITLLAFNLNAQCFPDRHNTSWFDGWISCDASENPNLERGNSHWISYDFGELYQLNELTIWNINAPELLTSGAQNIVIDYSLDGVNWVEFSKEKIPIATGISTYEGDLITNFNGIKAKYLLITIIDNYGGTCNGFAELKVAAEKMEDENSDICIIADVFPNPFSEQLSITLNKKCLGKVYLTIEDAIGRNIISESTIKLDETKTLSTTSMAPGVYFVCLRNGEITERYKVVKK